MIYHLLFNHHVCVPPPLNHHVCVPPLPRPQVRMYSRALAIIGGFLVLASGAGEVYRQKPRTRSLQSTGQVFLGIYLICMVMP